MNQGAQSARLRQPRPLPGSAAESLRQRRFAQRSGRCGCTRGPRKPFRHHAGCRPRMSRGPGTPPPAAQGLPTRKVEADGRNANTPGQRGKYAARLPLRRRAQRQRPASPPWRAVRHGPNCSQPDARPSIRDSRILARSPRLLCPTASPRPGVLRAAVPGRPPPDLNLGPMNPNSWAPTGPSATPRRRGTAGLRQRAGVERNHACPSGAPSHDESVGRRDGAGQALGPSPWTNSWPVSFHPRQAGIAEKQWRRFVGWEWRWPCPAGRTPCTRSGRQETPPRRSTGRSTESRRFAGPRSPGRFGREPAPRARGHWATAGSKVAGRREARPRAVHLPSR